MAKEDPIEVLADERGQAAVLRAKGHEHDARLIEQLCDRFQAAAFPYLNFMSSPKQCSGPARTSARCGSNSRARAARSREEDQRQTVLPRVHAGAAAESVSCSRGRPSRSCRRRAMTRGHDRRDSRDRYGAKRRRRTRSECSSRRRARSASWIHASPTTGKIDDARHDRRVRSQAGEGESLHRGRSGARVILRRRQAEASELGEHSCRPR
jgi:hypothetical protein